MARLLSSLGGAAVLLGVVAVACGTDNLGIDVPQIDDGGLPGQDAAKPPTTTTDAGTDSGPVTPPPPAESFVIGGNVTGLQGTGLVLQNNAGDDVTVNADGQFVFKTKIEKGKTFNVTVKTQPTAPSQTCTVSGATGTVVTAVNTVVVNCAANTFTVGGTIAGLAGTGLVLQNNLGNDATIGADGTFAFTTPIASGAPYSVTVKTQPSNLSQTCTVANSTGTIAGGNVTSVAVTCVTNKFSVGGNVTGLVGSGLVLQNSGGGDLPVAADGTFTFPAQDDGTAFAVTVKTSPSAPVQTCVVTGGTGTVAGGNVTGVNVNCADDKFAISGTVSGLDGTGLVLQNNGGDALTINADGSFAFATTLADLTAYAVTVQSQPTNKWQTCTVSNGNGNVAAAPVSNVTIVCTTNGYKVRGTVTGLDGTGLALQNNAGDDLAISANGAFEFATPVASGAGYLVSTLTNPSNKSQTCTVTSGGGTVAGADIADVAVTCVTNTYSVGGNVTGLVGAGLILQNNGGDNLSVGADGSFTFAGELQSGQTFAVTVLSQPNTPSQNCVVSGDTGTVTAGNIVSVTVNCSTNTFTAGGTVSGLAGTGLVLQNNGGSDVAINANGSFAFAPQADGSGYAITVKTQPTAKSQTCSVTNGSGNLAGANVTSAVVTCVTDKFAVGGTIAGLVAQGVVLTNNGVDDLTVNANGNFAFATAIDSGSTYAVAIKTQPSNRYCTVTNGNGTVNNTAITTVTVTCTNGNCKTVNGMTWCRDAVQARSCNAFCTAIGLGNPSVSDAEWFAAQDTTPECSAIATAFGIGATSVNGYTYACAEARGFGINDLACSNNSSCPAAHRTASDGSEHYALCPCAGVSVCGTSFEGGATTVTCPVGMTIQSISYASYGTPNGTCGSFTNGSCNASNSKTIVDAECLGKASCSVSANNGVFGDPCGGTPKRLYIQASCY